MAHSAPGGLSGPSARPGLESLLDGALASGTCQCGPRRAPKDSGVEVGVTLPRALVCTSENHACTAHSEHSSLCRILWGECRGPVSGPMWKEGQQTDMWASSFHPRSHLSRKALHLLLFFLVMLDETWLYFKKASVLKIPFGTVSVSGWPCWQGPVKEAGLQRSLQKALFSLLRVEGFCMTWPSLPPHRASCSQGCSGLDESKIAPFTSVQQGPAHLLVAHELCTCVLCVPSAHGCAECKGTSRRELPRSARGSLHSKGRAAHLDSCRVQTDSGAETGWSA